MTATSSAIEGSPTRTPTRRLAALWRRFREAREKRRAVREMRNLDNRTLKDIGINRSEILSIVHGDRKHKRRRQTQSWSG